MTTMTMTTITAEQAAAGRRVLLTARGYIRPNWLLHEGLPWEASVDLIELDWALRQLPEHIPAGAAFIMVHVGVVDTIANWRGGYPPCQGCGRSDTPCLPTCPYEAWLTGMAHDCPRQRFMDDPITRAYGVGDMVAGVECKVCDEQMRA